MDEHNIAVIPGDLNGITVTEATLKVSEALSHLLTKPIKHKIVFTGYPLIVNLFAGRITAII